MPGTFLVVHANLISPFRVIEDGFVLIQDGVISEMGEMADCDLTHGFRVLDLEGQYLSPGWIDAHTHGGFGFDFMNCSLQEGLEILNWLPSTGVTGVLPTIASSSLEEQLNMVQKLIQMQDQRVSGAKILGFHLEGPYISPEKRGAQPESAIRLPMIDEMEQILAAARGQVRLVTLAPELPGVLDLIRFLVKNGITVSCGHSNATYEEFNLAAHHGLNRVAHTFNAMPPFHHRKPGILGAAFINEDVFCELILDGIHVHPSVAQLLIRIKGIEKTVLITDATQAAGLQDGVYVRPGNRVIYVRDGIARLESGVLAGSTLTMNRAIKNAVDILSMQLKDAIHMASFSAASSLRLDQHKGEIVPGKDADFVVLDKNLSVKMTFVAGKIVYNSIS